MPHDGRANGDAGFLARGRCDRRDNHDYNYAQVLTLDLLRKGCAFEEVPIRYRLREQGESFITWRYPAMVLPAIWRELRSA